MEGDDEGGGGQLGHCQVAARHQAGLYVFVEYFLNIQKIPM